MYEGVYGFNRVVCVVDRGVNDVESAVHVGNIVCVSQVVGNVNIRLHGKGNSNSHGARPVC